MTKLDELIHKALEDQDKAILAETDELGYWALGLSQFTGKMGWVTWLVMLIQALMFFGSVYCAVEFYGAVDVLSAVKWGISGATLMIIAISLKLSLAPQMHADRVIREIKRLELLLLSRGQQGRAAAPAPSQP